MDRLLDWSRGVRAVPLWAYPAVAAATALVFAVTLPGGMDATPDVVLEGAYLALAALLIVPIRRLGVPVLEWGGFVFLFGRFVDFLDEVFVEPEPIVEPYLSGLVMVVSLAVIVLGTQVLLRDRSERLDSLRERTAELELKNEAIDEAPVGVTIADMTREGEPLTYANEGFARLTGYAVDGTVGRNCRFLQGEETDPERVARMRAAIENREPVQVTVRNYRKDGTPFWNEVTLAPLSTDGEEGDGDGAEHYVGFQQDVTDRVEYERRLEDQRDNLDILNRMVGHDIRNDLQVVLANVSLLSDEVGEDAQDRLNTAAASARSAVALTETAGDLAEAITDGQVELTAVPLGQTLEREVTEVASTFDGAVVRVDGSIPDVAVDADGMLGSVFRNILKNAVQHNDKPVPEVTVSATAGSGQVTVRIADNGPGIEHDRKGDIFGRGEKGLSSDGTGIGMSLVDTLVDRYGGSVSVGDNDPEGAVFTVTLPTAS